MQPQFPIGKPILTKFELSLILELENWTCLSRWAGQISGVAEERLQL